MEDEVVVEVCFPVTSSNLNGAVNQAVNRILVPLFVLKQLIVLGKLRQVGAVPLSHERKIVIAVADDGLQLINLGKVVPLALDLVVVGVVLEDDPAKIVAGGVTVAVDGEDYACATLANLLVDFELELASIVGPGAFIRVVVGLAHSEFVTSRCTRG